MKKILMLIVALVLTACCQNSEAWFNGGKQSIMQQYPKKGTQCEYKAQVTGQMVQDFQAGRTEAYENMDTYYNFGRIGADEVAIIITMSDAGYERYYGTPVAAYREVLAACKARQY